MSKKYKSKVRKLSKLELLDLVVSGDQPADYSQADLNNWLMTIADQPHTGEEMRAKLIAVTMLRSFTEVSAALMQHQDVQEVLKEDIA